jgi:hypothetical protein
VGQTNDRPEIRRKPKNGTTTAVRFDSSRFVQYELDKAQQQACKNWQVSSSDLWQSLLGLLDDGYSATFKFDTFSSAYACFIQARQDTSHVNYGLVLAGRGSTPEKAIKQALFKIHAIGPSWHEFAEHRQQVIDD